MTTWVKENCTSFLHLFCIRVLKTGRIPQHVAFIMDGNRRFAKKQSVDTAAGHSKGFEKLSEALKWCLDLGIPEVTAYAFSIENFKRSKEEVDSLMELACEKFERFIQEVESVNEWGVRMHIGGRMSLLPEKLRVTLAKAVLATRKNNKLHLNIAFAYTGRDEISRAASYIVDGVHNNELSPEDIDEDLISQSMDFGEPELLIRTSGEVRLSDFMMWQVSNTVLYFSDVLWPEFTIWNFLSAVIHFQRNAPPGLEEKEKNPVQLQFLKNLELRKTREWENILGC